MYTVLDREFLDVTALAFKEFKSEGGFKNQSLALAEYTNGEETNLGIFLVIGQKNANPNLKHNYEFIFTSIDNINLGAAKDVQNNDLEEVDRSDFDTDMGLVVAPTIKITKFGDLKAILKMLDRYNLVNKEILTLANINEILDFAKSNTEIFGFSSGNTRN